MASVCPYGWCLWVVKDFEYLSSLKSTASHLAHPFQLSFLLTCPVLTSHSATTVNPSCWSTRQLSLPAAPTPSSFLQASYPSFTSLFSRAPGYITGLPAHSGRWLDSLGITRSLPWSLFQVPVLKGTLPRPYLTPTIFGSSERQGGRRRPQAVTVSNVKPTPKDHQERASRAFPQRTVPSRRPYQRTDMLNKFTNILFICPRGSHAHTHLLYSPPTLLPWKCPISLPCTTLAPPSLLWPQECQNCSFHLFITPASPSALLRKVFV